MQQPSSLKYKIGMICIVLGIISPLIGLVIPFLGLPAATTTTIVAAFMIGGPEIFLVLGAALAGKEGLTTVKSTLFAPAGRARYQIGIFLVVAGVLGNWVLAYLELSGLLQWDINTMLTVTAVTDLVTIAGALLAGVEFFAKIWRLFRWEGAAPPVATAAAEQ